MDLTNPIKEKIQTVLPEAIIYVLDPHQDGEHFEAIVISDTFVGIPLVKQHQVVMNALKDEFKERVHALALKTFTPEKWDNEKHKFPLAE